MLNKYVMTGALAVACSGALLAAQAPAPQPQDEPRTQSSPQSPPQSQTPRPGTQTQAAAPTTTVVGCVYRERDVPGRAPNVAERVGVLEDYILAEVTGESGAAGAPNARGTTGTSGAAGAAKATGTSGAGRMYKLEFVDDDKLQDLVGKRVAVTGKIDAEAGDSKAPAGSSTTSTTDKVIGRDQVNLSEFEVASIKEVAGACPSLK